MQSVVLTNATAVSRGKTGRIQGKKYRRKECGGFYHQRQKGEPAWIEIVVDNVVADTPAIAMKVPFIRETLFAGALFHEIGHHLDNTIGGPAPSGEAAAEAWNKRLFAQYLLKHYWYAVPVLKIFRALFGGAIRRRIAAWKRKHNAAGQFPDPPHSADAKKRDAGALARRALRFRYWEATVDSASLHGHGVAVWAAFTRSAERDLLLSLPRQPGVYTILLPDFQPRCRGRSDIAYIGRAVNQNGIRGRIRQYFHPGPTQRTNILMRRRLSDPGCALRLGFVATQNAASAKRLESDLLLQFEVEHGELPPYNRQRALDLMSRLERGENAG